MGLVNVLGCSILQIGRTYGAFFKQEIYNSVEMIFFEKNYISYS